jgi:hypothetical protein
MEQEYINQHLYQWTETYEAVGSNSTARAAPFGTKPIRRADQHQLRADEFQIPPSS